MMQNIFIFTLSLFMCINSHAKFEESGDYQSVTPLYKKQRASFTSLLTQRFSKIYTKKINSKDLKVVIDWNNTKVNAYASFDDHDNPYVLLTGAMAGHELMNGDAITMVICHEIGHFLGGAPKQNRGRSQKKSWSSAEGQADYYASAYCMKALLYDGGNPSNITFESTRLDPQVHMNIKSICLEDTLCQRIVNASYRLASVYAEVKYYYTPLSLTKRSEEIVQKTILNHPNPQCRLDTMIAGALCPSSLSIDFKEKKVSECRNRAYARPQCWYNNLD